MRMAVPQWHQANVLAMKVNWGSYFGAPHCSSSPVKLLPSSKAENHFLPNWKRPRRFLGLQIPQWMGCLEFYQSEQIECWWVLFGIRVLRSWLLRIEEGFCSIQDWRRNWHSRFIWKGNTNRGGGWLLSQVTIPFHQPLRWMMMLLSN